MEISFYLKRPNSDAPTSIFARISYEGAQIKYYIPEKIKPEFWNNETRRAKETKKFKEYPEFNTRLDNITAAIRDEYRTYINNNADTIPGPETFKALLDKRIKKIETPKEKIHSFFEYFEDFIKRSKDGTRMNIKTKTAVVHGTTKGFANLLNHLKAFQATYKRKIDFNTIDLEFYNDYVKYISKTKKLGNNTIGDHIKRIKTILNEATENGLNTNLAFRSKYFTRPSENSDSIYLNEDELKEIEEINLSKNEKLDRVRDLFLVGLIPA